MAVRTVLGDIPASELGVTHGHEHVLFSPARGFGPDLSRTEEHLAIEELDAFRAAGGSGLVDATVQELGRDPSALQRISSASGVHVIAATGHTAEQWWWGESDPRNRSVDAIAEQMVADLTDGIAGTGVKAGVIKVGTSLQGGTDAEIKVIRAAGKAQQATGAPITTHTTAGKGAQEQVDELARAGADLGKVCIGHLDRALVWQEHLELVRTGVYLGYDQISKEKYQQDSLRADFILRMVDQGYGGSLLLGSDLARRSDLSAWGGNPGLTYLSTTFVTLLTERDVSFEEIRRLLINNPRRFLVWG